MMNSKKNLIAAAVVAAFALPIAAQAQSNVEMYGRLYPQLANVSYSGSSAVGTVVSTISGKATGAADVSQLTMDSPNSRLGFRGTEDLGGGSKAFYQLEMGFGVDDGAMSTAGIMWARNSFVGMAGNFGSVKLGIMDTVYKELGDTNSILGISSGNFMSVSNVLSKPGTGISAGSFHLRRGNSIVYTSPTFANVTVLFDYSLGETAGSISTGSVISTGATYDSGPIYLALAYEQHNNMWGGSPTALSAAAVVGATSTDTAMRGTARYTISSDTKVEVNVANIKYKEEGGGIGKFSTYDHLAWAASFEQKLGAITLAGSYGSSNAGSCALVGGAACSTNGLEGSMLNLAAGYSFSKRTMLYGVFTQITNGSAAVFSNAVSTVKVGKPTPGTDIGTFAIGLKHDF
jgi:predicted porin